MEGKTVAQIYAAAAPEFARLRAHWSDVSPRLLNELQDLHDRVGKCLPSLFRDIVLEGCPRVAQTLGLSLRMTRLWATYRKIPGPFITERKKAVTPQPVVVLSSPFASEKRETAVGTQSSFAEFA